MSGNTGGLLALVAYGGMNTLISGNPQVSYFNKVFNRYTHFSTEPINLALSTTTLWTFDAPATFRIKVPRIADLLGEIFFQIRLPAIYSKVYTPPGGNPTLDSIPYEFQWVHDIGLAALQSASIYIGGQEMSRIDGDWLFARKQLEFNDTGAGEIYSRMVGDIPELYDPSAGVYAWLGDDGSRAYPSVIATSTSTQNNRFSIPETILRIPLSFWLSDAFSLSLPLIALQYHEVEISVTLRPTQQLYTVIDVYSTDSPQPRIRPRNQPDMRPAAFFLDAGMGNASSDSWLTQPSFDCTCAYLTDFERNWIAHAPQNYPIRRMQREDFLGITNDGEMNLDDKHGLCTRIIWWAQRPDARPERNDWRNYTNWVNPFIAPRQDGTDVPVTTPNSGVNLMASQRDLIRGAKLVCDGVDIMAIQPSAYFSTVQPYKYAKDATGWLGLYLLSFELFHDPTQPAGTLNLSLFNRVRLYLQVYPPASGLTHSISVFVETLNFLHIESGMAALAYAL